MKPFRRTSVITFMAACAAATGWGQQNLPVIDDVLRAQNDILRAQDERRAQLNDALRAQNDAIRAQVETAKEKLGQQKLADSEALRAQMNAARAQLDASKERLGQVKVDWPDSDALRIQLDMALAQVDAAREKVETANWLDGKIGTQFEWAFAPQQGPKPVAVPMPPAPAEGPRKYIMGRGESGDRAYESGKRALDNRHYEEAAQDFDRVITGKSSTRADGAYYWKAYALNKLGKRDEALAALAELPKQFPQSNWLNDAKALQVEVQQASGQPPSPENQADEDLKVYAVSALVNSDPDRAIPLLETLLNNPKTAPRLKERALYVLAQTRSDRAHQIVARYAKGGSNPDLQLVAVQYLGTYRSKESQQTLAEVYGSTNDVNVKRAVLRGYMSSRDVEHLLSAAKSDQNADLRREAIRDLGQIREEQSTAGLVALYSSESDKNVRSDILNALYNQNAAKQIVDCARKETDPELKREAVQKLTTMRSPAATDFLMELLSK